MELERAEGGVDAALRDYHPGKGTAEKTTNHPKGGLDSEVGATIFVTNEL